MNKEVIENKRKKNEKRRLIAKYISLISLVGMFTFGGVGIGIIQPTIDKDVERLETKKYNVITSFLNSSEFKHELQTAINSIVADYTTKQLTYEEFESKLNYLNSIDYADEIFTEVASPELKEQMKALNLEIIDLKSNSPRSTLVNIMGAGFMSSAGVYMISRSIGGIIEMKEH